LDSEAEEDSKGCPIGSTGIGVKTWKDIFTKKADYRKKLLNSIDFVFMFVIEWVRG